ncbi:MAG TPA: glycosyltransferase family 2 protein [Ramlibacter sp.]|jgi:glycosyltransferase involved in cell wall biosynthesis|nr:glycosyltransferase family 2 protein [Ramlibacter sp.]
MKQYPSPGSDRKELTILMPCLNEERTIGTCIAKAIGFLERCGIDGEVLVADNGSTDGSRELAEAAGARVVQVQQRGYGSALIGGIAAAKGRFVIMGDADDSYDFSRLEGFVESLRAGADLVMGNRFRGGIAPGAMPPLHRYVGNPVLSLIGRVFFRIKVGDFHCGLRGFSRERVLALGLASPGMEFATELVAKAAMAGYDVREVPTSLQPDGRGRAPHLRTWRDGWRHLIFMLLFTPRWLFLYPGILATALGAVGIAWLARGPLVFDHVGLDVHSMLYFSAALVLGTQMIQFALIAKWIAALAGIVNEPGWITQTKKVARVELGLMIGLAVFASGFGWSFALFDEWRRAGYSALDPQSMMRAVIPAVTLMILGVQAMAGSLLAGAVQLAWKALKNR